eukprot:CAMPEP_0197598462 /NCGR_PEP_ID=MMETSP1326-20131121/29360_1 /TAXON_ID=1155430 /ORGANISM="Genus nov. species nov., Strain RCC2288" /LENGTH=83 /DNA_ID=CAMNT_0043165267 /DNA_START=158 /DNA_END=405 /DNA_ORIENTATION=-
MSGVPSVQPRALLALVRAAEEGEVPESLTASLARFTVDVDGDDEGDEGVDGGAAQQQQEEGGAGSGDAASQSQKSAAAAAAAA